MANFATYYPKLLQYEGGYASADFAKKQNDKGGETYLGIARNYNPAWEGWKVIDAYKAAHGEPKWNSHIPDANLDKMAMDMSKQLYWDKLKLDQVKSQSLAEYIMDFGFNSGLGTPVKIVQETVGLKPDGVMGNDTINKINTSDPSVLFNTLKDRRVHLINGLSQYSDTVRGGLLKRANSFSFADVGTIIKNNPIPTGIILGFFLSQLM